MAWRFKASKYKNAAPIVPKPEACIRDICVGSYQTYGNNICASAAFMAFNWEHVGSSMAVLPLDDCGRKSKTMPLLHAHSDTITDMEFSPFHDGLLLTGSQDSLVSAFKRRIMNINLSIILTYLFSDVKNLVFGFPNCLLSYHISCFMMVIKFQGC